MTGEGSITFAQQTEMDLPSYRPNVLTTSKSPSRFTPHSSRKRAAFTLAEGATHVAQLKNVGKAAFTLAEVLITLGIIGVVAAMTMPSLVANYQKKSYDVQKDKAISTIIQAVERIKVDEGVDMFDDTSISIAARGSECTLEMYYTYPNCKAVYDNFLKYFNNARIEQIPSHQVSVQEFSDKTGEPIGDYKMKEFGNRPYIVLPGGILIDVYFGIVGNDGIYCYGGDKYTKWQNRIFFNASGFVGGLPKSVKM